MFSVEFSLTLEEAYREASNRKHSFFCVEHLLYALLFDKTIINIIENCDGDVEKLKKDLEGFFNQHLEQESSEHVGGQAESQVVEPIQTPAFQRVVQRAIQQVHFSGKDIVGGKDVFVQILSEEDSHAAYFLAKQNINRLDVLEYISHGLSEDLENDEEGLDYSGADEDELETSRNKKRKKILGRFTEDLTKLAGDGKLDPIIGREAEIERMLKILSRRMKNNPLLLGDPGVGKTAMSSAIAQKIISGEVPDNLKNAKVFSLNIGSLIAGTKFRGEFEERLRKIIEELSGIDNAILFIDEIHTIIGAGATGTGSMDAANLLKPALAAGKIRCVGSTTHEDYKKAFEKDRALDRRFSVIDLDETTLPQTISILEGLKDKFEEHHGVKYSKTALKAAVELSARHINDRFLPDKAIDVIDEAGAANNLLSEAKRKKIISDKDVEKVVAAIAKVPIKSVSSSDEKKLLNLENEVKWLVFGQDPAVEAVCQAIKRSRANLTAQNKPMGCFLFAGPTGVGKTELARALSTVLGVPFHRFDMSEYIEKHTVARLIGAPPGYVGYEEGGILTDLVRKQPYAVLLFDEIEKAHEDIYNILLQVMDEASLTDSHGKKADFRNVVLILTTNAGSDKAHSLGFGNLKSDSNREKAVKQLFKPEFRNRLDEIIYFNSLPLEIIARIVDKFIYELENQLAERNIKFELSDSARNWLAEKGFDPILGARPMARLIQKKIKDPLADEILFGGLKKGGKVKIDLEGEELKFLF
jgi:ATP-dependent Clp protease ATP-binding subunit ClpA